MNVSDYTALIKAGAGYVETMNVWGGEDNVPPEYGRVFISIKPVGREVMTDSEKIQLKENVLGRKRVINIEPVFVDPEYQYIEIRASVRYDPSKTVMTEQQLESKVKDAMVSYAGDAFLGFDSVFRKSSLLTFLDSSDDSVVSSDLDLFVQRRLKPLLGVKARYDISFTVPLANPKTVTTVISSEGFQYTIDDVTYTCFLRNKEGTGVIEIYRNSTSGDVIVASDAGYIDTTTNTLVLVPFEPSGVTDSDKGIRISAVPADQNKIAPDRNVLIRLDADRSVVSAESDV